MLHNLGGMKIWRGGGAHIMSASFVKIWDLDHVLSEKLEKIWV